MKHVNATVMNTRDDTTANGSQIDANQLISASFHVVPGKNDDAGTLKIQASNDLPTNLPQDFTVTNWVDVPSATATISSGAQALITINQTSYRWLRCVWTHTGGGSSTTKMVVNMMAMSV